MVSNFAAERLHIIAQAFSPALHSAKAALKVAAKARLWAVRMLFIVPQHRMPLFLLRPCIPANYGGQAGHHLLTANPGLKPWAVLYSRFAANSTVSVGTE
jgi:hypothetical protein